MKKKKILIAGLAALLAAGTIGTTWAAWTQTLLAKNEFMTAKYSTFLEETFEGPENWQPGITEQKDVWVKNDSTIPVIAKITMKQSWVRHEAITAATLSEATPAVLTQIPVADAGEELPLVFDSESGDEEFAAILNFNSASDWKESAVVVLEENRAADENLRLNIPTVPSLKDAEGKWLLVSEEPMENGYYTFYYIGEVPADGGTTPLLLNSVTMNPELEATISGSHTYYVEDETAEDGYRKITVNTVNGKGYDGCTYTMDVTMTTAQATDAAIKDVFQTESEQFIIDYIAGYITGDGVYESDSKNTLAFDEVNGKMVYYPIDQISADGKEGGNWFMSFTNMVPGGTYIDRLDIENRSRKKYELFMQIKPRVQDELRDELLKKISMEVYYGDSEKETLLYKGDATGYHYTDANGTDMQSLVSLGYYYVGRKEQIRVVLQLDPDIGLNDDGTYKYADLLTKIDWEFYVTEVTGGRSPGGSGGGGGGGGSGHGPGSSDGGEVLSIEDELIPLAALPATGDNMPVIPVIVTALVSMFLMLLFAKLSKKEKAE